MASDMANDSKESCSLNNLQENGECEATGGNASRRNLALDLFVYEEQDRHPQWEKRQSGQRFADLMHGDHNLPGDLSASAQSKRSSQGTPSSKLNLRCWRYDFQAAPHAPRAL